ncbi:hypothetical protein HOJ01_02405 [bacterium]|jgi:branched-chain amino acid aminotransferase|nr:hypothetical protein [bacterium]MBT6293636.1 hypothetical protein [bacterium]
MTFIKKIQPIGNVSFTEGNYDFPSFKELKSLIPQLKDQDRVQSEIFIQEKLITKLLNGEIQEFYTCSPETYLKQISAQELQIYGINITGFQDENPYGTYCLDSIHRAFQPIKINGDRFEIYRFTKFPSENFSIITKKPEVLTQDEINQAKFTNLTTSSQVISICKQIDDVWQWSPSKIYPDGMHLMPSLNSCNQYAQSGFEGLAAMIAENGDIVVSRPYDNARRLQSTCISIGMPPISEEQFFESIKHALIANKNYLPSPGSNSKMYVRPHIQGINGGTGVAPASEYLFSVQAFPFGDYFANRESVIDLVALPNTRRSFKHGMGDQKVSSNYGPTFTHKMMAKQGLISDYPNTKFNDVYYFGESIDPITNQIIEVLEEDAAGNIFFISNPGNNLTLTTPSLNRGTILPGFTRDTVLKMAYKMGIIVQELNHIIWEDMHNFQGAFLTGSAAGIVRIASMSYRGEKIEFNTQNELNKDIIAHTYYNLYDFLYDLRRGNFETFADCPEISSIPIKIGNVFEL